MIHFVNDRVHPLSYFVSLFNSRCIGKNLIDSIDFFLHLVEIGKAAFYGCTYLESVEFGNKLESIGRYAFEGSISIKYLKLPSVITIGMLAFCSCKALTDIEFSERLETIETRALAGCDRLERIAIPLKRGLFVIDDLFFRYNQFDNCDRLRTVDLVGGAHTKTATSLHSSVGGMK